MKRNTTFIFAGIMSAVIGNAYATGENIVTSKSYVDNALEQKQNNIPARETKISDDDQSFAPSVVTNGTTDGDVGQMAIVTYERMDSDGLYWDDYANSDSLIPTLGAVGYELEEKQNNIPARETKISDDDQSFAPSVVTNGTTDGDVGQMAILTYERMDSDNLWWDDYSNFDYLIPTIGAVGHELDRKANHMTCAGWPESVAVADRTDANCWLWNKN